MRTGRPSAKVLRSCVDIEKSKEVEIIESDGVFVVFDMNQNSHEPMGLRVMTIHGYKYPKAVFTRPGHAKALARRLNKMFKTNSFVVMRATTYKVEEDHD